MSDKPINQKALLQAVSQLIGEVQDTVESKIGETREDLGKTGGQLRDLAEKMTEVAADRREMAAELRSLSEKARRLSDANDADAAEYKTFRDDLADSLAELSTRLDAVDDNQLLKGTASALCSANLASIRKYCDDILLRRATFVKGDRKQAILKGLF